MLSGEFQRSSGGLAISLSLIFILPGSVTAILVFLSDLAGVKPEKHYRRAPMIIMGLVLLASALILQEGAICIFMIAPFWFLSSYLGSRIVYSLQQKYKVDGGLNCFILAVLPFVALFIEGQFPQPTEHYVVKRSVTINADAKDIWPLLVTLDDIQAEEGRWNITQNLLGVPKPAKAVIDLEAMPYIRHAQWGEHVTFEEHITTFDVNEKMKWNFEFPNDSVSAYTDRHISADGYHLKIKTGGYELISISSLQTTLVLETQYRATSPVNLYAKLWGELILGDIQNNILHLIQDRVETSSNSFSTVEQH